MRHRASVIGSISLTTPDGDGLPLTPGRRETLAKLVAGGPDGISASEFLGVEPPEATSDGAKLRTAVSRLRSAGVPDDWIASDGRGGYRLALRPHEVDVWELEALAAGGELPDDDVLSMLLTPANAYQNVPNSLIVERAVDRFRSAQRSLLNRLFEVRPASVEHHAATLTELIKLDPYDEKLILTQAAVLSKLGHQREALDVLRAASNDFAELGLALSEDVRQLEADILNGRHTVAPSGVRSPLPPRIRSIREGHWVGSRAPIERLIEVLGGTNETCPLALVDGISGSGKSRVVAEAAVVAHDRGWEVVLVSGGLVGGDMALAPFVGALKVADPSLASDLAMIDGPSQRLQQFARLDSAFGRVSSGRSVLIVIDDAQGLDETSLDYVASIVAAPPAAVEAIFVNGRPGIQAAGIAAWRRIEALVRRAGAVTVTPQPLTENEMGELVSLRRPSLRLSAVDRLARELHRVSSGLPGVAVPLLAALSDEDPQLSVELSLGAASPLTALVGGLPESLRCVGAAVAVASAPIRSDELVRLLNRAGINVDGVDVLDALHELVDRELVKPLPGHKFEVAHILVRAAFSEGVGRGLLARLHGEAAEMSTDIHRRAHHLWQGAPIVPVSVAADALSDAARESLRQGNPTLASEQFETLADSGERVMSLEERASWARALDLSGSRNRAEEVRSPAYELAAAERQWSAALRVATSSLPEGELFDGDVRLVERLRELSAASVALPRDDSWNVALGLARQGGLVGDFDMMRAGLRRMGELARTPSERVQLGLTRRFTSAFEPAESRLAILDRIAPDFDEVSEYLRCEYLINRCVDLWSAGRCPEAREALLSLGRLEERNDRDLWLEELLHALMATEDEDEDASERRRSAFGLGNRAGLADADTALLAGEFVELWLAGEHAILAPAVDSGEVDIDGLLLASAAAAAILWETGDQRRAGELARSVVARALASPIIAGVPALIWVSGVLEAIADEALSRQAVTLLDRSGDSMVVIGAGAAGLGPVTRYSARLVSDEHTKEVLLRRALRTAEASGLGRWRRIVTADLEALRA